MIAHLLAGGAAKGMRTGLPRAVVAEEDRLVSSTGSSFDESMVDTGSPSARRRVTSWPDRAEGDGTYAVLIGACGGVHHRPPFGSQS